MRFEGSSQAKHSIRSRLGRWTRAPQQPAGRVYRLGYLSSGSRDQQLSHIRAFEDGLRSLGYRVGENVVIEYRFANAEIEQLPALAADLVGLGVDVIVSGANPNTVAAMKATTPIVMANNADPVSAGLVASLARPGGNRSTRLPRTANSPGSITVPVRI